MYYNIHITVLNLQIMYTQILFLYIFTPWCDGQMQNHIKMFLIVAIS